MIFAMSGRDEIRKMVQSNERPMEAYVLSLIAGLTITVVGLLWISFMGLDWSIEWMNWYDSFMHPADQHFHFMSFGTFGYAFGVVGIILGIGIIASSEMLRRNPREHGTWGAIIIVLSVFSIFGGMGGMGIGLILGIIGGILAIQWSPRQGSHGNYSGQMDTAGYQ